MGKYLLMVPPAAELYIQEHQAKYNKGQILAALILCGLKNITDRDMELGRIAHINTRRKQNGYTNDGRQKGN